MLDSAVTPCAATKNGERPVSDDPRTMPPTDEVSVSDVPTVGSAAAASRRTVHSMSGRTLLAIVTVAVVVVVAVAGVWGNARWGRHAMVVTGAVAAQALVEGRADNLAAVSNATVRSQLTTTVADSMREQGVLGDFSAAKWSGDEATITASTGSGPGLIVVLPSTDGANVVIFRTLGSLGIASGALGMERTWSGWAVSGLTVAPTEQPADHPSVSTSSTAPATSTP